MNFYNIMARGEYESINEVDRQRLVNAFQEGRDWINVAEMLGIKRQSARNIIVKFRITGMIAKQQRGGPKNRKFDQEMTNFIKTLIENKPTITLKEMNEKLRIELPEKPHVTYQALSLNLDGMFYSIKDIRHIPIQWNLPQQKLERRIYADWLLREGLHQHKIFVDEFGVNIWTSRSKGRAQVGERAVRILEGQRGKNVTICLAVSAEIGLVHSVTIEGGMTNDLFTGFLMELSQILTFNEEPSVILFDNARAHGNLPNVGERHIELKYLPKYSPFLNMCEMAGSCLKSALKRRIADPIIQEEVHNRDAGETLHQRRLRILIRETEPCLQEITIFKCNQWYNHTMGYMPLCMREEDIYE